MSTCVFSPDGRYIISAGYDGDLTLWNVDTGQEMAAIEGLIGAATVCAFSHDGLRIVMGSHGQVLLAVIENVEFSAPIVTPVRIRISTPNKDTWYWDDAIRAACRNCGQRFAVPAMIIGFIREISLYGDWVSRQLSRHQTPDQAWNDPRLLSECPLCGKPLRFNPFLVDNRGSN